MPDWPQRAFREFLLGACLLSLVGCGKNLGAPVPVRGKVVNEEGNPVADVIVVFHPQEDVNKNNLPSGLVDKQGSFSFTCLRGRYKVTFGPIAAIEGPPLAPGQKAGKTAIFSEPK